MQSDRPIWTLLLTGLVATFGVGDEEGCARSWASGAVVFLLAVLPSASVFRGFRGAIGRIGADFAYAVRISQKTRRVRL